MLDEFPASAASTSSRSALAFMAGYRVRAFLVAQSLNQIDKAYGLNHSILDNCHVRVAFTPNDERTAQAALRCAGDGDGAARSAQPLRHRLSAWLLAHDDVRTGDTAAAADAGRDPAAPRPGRPGDGVRPTADPGQEAQYYNDHNFLARRLPAPDLAAERTFELPATPATTGRARPASPAPPPAKGLGPAR